ncbi:ribosomal L7Ae/L30e/S12e/Gadd45 family protein [Candidatus Woesearchaeota archaeon]|nr:ribosomal L7Ae/L30e/S12e/Gadd45 family protein [Candidatus Woesearchaeota archaeon]
MAKKEISEDVLNIKKSMDNDKLVIGFNEVKKGLMSNELKQVYMASNTPESMIEDVDKLATISSTDVKKLKQANDDLGIVCKKPYFISVIGIKND